MHHLPKSMYGSMRSAVYYQVGLDMGQTEEHNLTGFAINKQAHPR